MIFSWTRPSPVPLAGLTGSPTMREPDVPFVMSHLHSLSDDITVDGVEMSFAVSIRATRCDSTSTATSTARAIFPGHATCVLRTLTSM